jgi:hypothetical protein
MILIRNLRYYEFMNHNSDIINDSSFYNPEKTRGIVVFL